MSEPAVLSPIHKPRQRGRKLAITAGVLLVLLALTYAVTTSAFFFKKIVLPRAGAALNATLTVEDVALSPFSSVSLRGLKVVTTGEPVLQAESALVRYSLWDILHDRLNVSELIIVAPKVKIVKNRDGKSNLDPITTALQSGKKKTKTKPPQLDLRNISLRNAAFQFVETAPNGTRQTIDLASINLTVDQIRTGISGKLNLATDVGFERVLGGTNAADSIQTKASAMFDFVLTPELLPQVIKGNTRVIIGNVQGAFRDLAGLDGTLDLEISPAEIKQAALRFTQAGKALGAISLSGPFEAARLEGRLKLDITAIDRQVLNLVGAPLGLDFGGTTLNASTLVELSQGAKVIKADGQFDLARFGVTRQGQTTPPLGLKLGYEVTINRNNQAALVQLLTLTGTQNQKTLLRGTLSQPMNLSWSTNAGANAIGDSAFNLELTDMNLADWRPFLGDMAAGQANLSLKVGSQKAGQRLEVNLTAQAANLALQVGTNRFDKAGVELSAQATVDSFTRVALQKFQVQLSRDRQPVARISGSGQFDAATGDADMQTALETSLPRLLALLGRADLSATAGDAAFTGRVTQKTLRSGAITNVIQSVLGNFSLTEFTGTLAGNRLEQFTARLDADLEIKDQALQIRKLAGQLTQARQPAGAFDMSGGYHLAKQTGQLAVRLDDVNQAAIRPFTAAALGNRTLVSVSISSALAASFNGPGALAVTGDLSVANLLVSDPEKKLPNTPLGLAVKLDAAMTKDKMELRQFSGKATFGSDAAGQFEAAGGFDFLQKKGRATLKLADLNQNALRPFTGPVLGSKTLISVAINGSSVIRFDAKGDSSAQASFTMANLVVNDPLNPEFARTPLAAQLQLDATLKQQLLDLNKFLVTLTPTARAKNELLMKGRLDLAKTNAMKADFQVQSESLDLTPYYDLIDNPNAKKAAANNNVTPAAANHEPDAVKLPLARSTFNVNIGRIFLREISVSNLVATLRVDGGHVELKPCQLSLNGAPVNAGADLNLAVPGWQYDLTFTADKVPVEPLANSFSKAYRGQAKGQLLANVQIKGAGTTGTSLRKNLGGQVSLSFTNANIQIVGPKAKAIITPIALLLNLPELLHSPINYLTTDILLGGGKIDMRQFTAHSDAFIARSAGVIPIADVLTNSPLSQPVDISLPRSLARKFSLSAPTNATHVQLPNFVKLAGTVGNPDVKTDKLVITGLTATGAAGFIPGQAGGILRGLGGILNGQQPAQTPPSANSKTNSPPAPNTSTNPPAKKPGPFDLLDLVPKKK